MFTSGENLTVSPEIPVVEKKGDGTSVSGFRVLEQKQEGLYTVVWHPIGGQPAPETLCALSDAIRDMDQAEMRLAPDESAYIVNLTGAEAEKIMEITADSAATLFETSVSCIGASICQVGLRDSQALLAACVNAVREAGIPNGALPQIHISGCPSSCGTHQTGAIGFRGASKSIDKKPHSAFMLYVNGDERQGQETMGKELGTILETQIPDFLVELGKIVADSGKDFAEWNAEDPEGLERVAAKYLA